MRMLEVMLHQCQDTVWQSRDMVEQKQGYRIANQGYESYDIAKQGVIKVINSSLNYFNRSNLPTI